MNVKVTAIREQGDLNKERVVMRVESACDIGEFILLQTGVRDGQVNTGVFQTFWFPDKPVRAGDYVVLYTKLGNSSERPFKDSTSHFFYMGLSETIWNHGDRGAVLAHAPKWQSFIPNFK